jgi:hypothetical protein
MEALAQALEDAQAVGEPVDALAEAVANDEAIKTEVIEDGNKGQLLVITAEPEKTEAMAQPESDVPAKKPMGKNKGKRGAAVSDGNK